ncbi:MAG: Rv3235 family protein [Mycobacterium sp.]|uniref:Rv3235 family protein n=1 Tax=Mycobacterium sp. TaxID=1785 RepID=UPI002630A0FB|nr:Rv3235 family protein [Mycobacterium sp.]MDI3314845.1 Rv3235 family protein [Mycobacterium sp.]
MTRTPEPRAAFAVTPVVDYEPPPGTVEHCRGVSPATLRQRPTRAPQRPGGPRPPAPEAPGLSPPMRQAAIFADSALRRVLEVIDRRRPAAQLRPVLAAGLLDAVLAGNRAVGGHGAAVLRRLRLQTAGRDGEFRAAEVFGTYSRGRRVHAIACRVELLPATGGTRWQIVALHIG